MIKKKVKKIPKYSIGSSGITPGVYDPNVFNKSTLYQPSILNSDAVQSFNQTTNAVNTTLSLDNPTLHNQQQFNQQMNQGLNDPTKNIQNDLRGVLGSTASGAGLGFMIGGPMGAGIGAAAGLLVDALPKIIGTGGSVDQNTGEIQYASGLGKIFGRDDAALRRESNRIKNVNLSRVQTENLKTDYYNNLNVPTSVNILAAEGGIVPGEHYASRGEVEVAADGTNAVRYNWDSKGKDTYHVYTNPDGSSAVGNMVFTEEGVKRPNGEKYSDAAEKIIKGTKEGSKLRQISLRKLANEMEGQKMGKETKKIKNGIPAHEDGKGGYNQNWESDMLKSPIAQALFGQNKKYNLFQPLDIVERAGYNYGPSYANYTPNLSNYDFSKLLMMPYTYLPKSTQGNSSPATVTVNKKSKTTNDSPEYEIVEEYTPNDYSHLKQLKPDSVISKLEEELFKPVIPEITGGRNWKRPLGKIAKNLSGYLPLIGAMIDKPRYHKEEPIISPDKRIPVDYDIRDILADNQLANAINSYNIDQMSPNTGQYLAAKTQAATNLMNANMKARIYQKNKQNELIAKNAGIQNDWNRYYDAASYRAIADTRENEAAADAQRDTRIKDDMGYLRDWQLTPFLKQYLSSGAYKQNIERIS